MNLTRGVWAAIRIGMGILFMYSGYCQLMEPIEYAELPLNIYALLPTGVVHVMAATLPWLHFILGAFLALGLMVNESALALLIILIGEEVFLAAAILLGRRAPFNGIWGGSLASVKIRAVLALAVGLGLLLIELRKRKTSFTLDDLLD